MPSTEGDGGMEGTDKALLDYADRAARFYARAYGFPPVAGRVLGYLFVCRPAQQTIDELAQALLASRTAVTDAVNMLVGRRAVVRRRAAGQRVDRVGLDADAMLNPRGFDGAVFREQAGLAREALAMTGGAEPERLALVTEAAGFFDFLAARLPSLLDEWRSCRTTD